MLRNILGITAVALAASVASAQQPTRKSSTIPASHAVPVVASQHARVPAPVVARKAARTTARTTAREERASTREDSLAAKKAVKKAAHHPAKSMKKHRSAKHARASHDSTAKKQ